MPLSLIFITNGRSICNAQSICLFKGVVVLFFMIILCSCGAFRWHSIEQIPAEEVAYIKDGVFVSGKYVRSTEITEIDGKPAQEEDSGLHEVGIGVHKVKIKCDEAEGTFNSNELLGKTKILEFEAQVQRTYLARCVPFTHWWIEDIENKTVVAGEKYSE